MFRIRLSSAFLVLFVVLSAAACSDDGPVQPDLFTKETVAGTYMASGNVGSITLTDGDGETIDLLETGVEIVFELDGDGTTTGSFFVPEGNEDGSDFDADLTGTWVLTGDTVEFAHSADTVLRDMKFVVQGKELAGSYGGGDETIKIVLVKS